MFFLNIFVINAAISALFRNFILDPKHYILRIRKYKPKVFLKNEERIDQMYA